MSPIGILARGFRVAATTVLVLWVAVGVVQEPRSQDGRPPAGEDHTAVGAAEALEELDKLDRGGQYDELLRRWPELMAQIEQGSGRHSREAAHAGLHRLQALWKTARFDESTHVAAASIVAAVREAGAGVEPLLARGLGLLANIEFVQGRYESARDHYTESLDLHSRISPAEDAAVASIRHNLGNVLKTVGQIDQAREAYEAALEARRQIWAATGENMDRLRVAKTLNNLALLLSEDVGDDRGARDLLEDVVLIRTEVLGEQHRDVGRSLHNLANVLSDLASLERHPGRTAAEQHRLRRRALGLYRRAQVIYDSEMSGSAGRNMLNLARLLSDLKRFEEAEPLFREAIERLEDETGAESWRVAYGLTHLGELHLRQGNLSAAREPLEEGLRIRTALLGETHPDIADSLGFLARLALLDGRSAEAVRLALETERIGREHARFVVSALEERRALRLARIRARAMSVALTGAASGGIEPGGRAAVLDAAIRSRALVLDEMIRRRQVLRLSQSAAGSRLSAELEEARAALARMASLAPDPFEPELYRAELAAAVERHDRAEAALARYSRSFRDDLDAGRAGLAEVQKALPGDSVLISYIAHDRLRMSGSLGEETGGPAPASALAVEPVRFYSAMVLTSEGSVQVVPLANADAVDRAVDVWRRVARTSDAAETEVRQAGEQLRRLILAPLPVDLETRRWVFMVPDGSLHRVNLAALPHPDGGYLVDRDAVFHLLTSERDLLPSPGRAGRGLLAVSGVDFDALEPVVAEESTKPGDARPSSASGTAGGLASREGPTTRRGDRICLDLSSTVWPPLEATSRETADLATVWPGEQTVLHGAAADESTVVRSMAGRRVIHLATHGFFVPRACGQTGAEVRTTPPLLRSGLVLAGANHGGVGGPEGPDGLLTAEEIAGLDLDGVEWAVLSACDTGLGDIADGEGVLGLQRAFRLAGARTVVMSLWPVEDEATRRWMSTLYRHRFDHGRSTAASVRTAARSLLAARRATGESTHPVHWGAFVAVGDWR